MLLESKRSEFIATFGHSVTYKKKGINSCSAVYQLLQTEQAVHCTLHIVHCTLYIVLYRLVYDDSRQLKCPKSQLKIAESCPLYMVNRLVAFLKYMYDFSPLFPF